MKINIFWFRRDLRLEDNTALQKALNTGIPVLALFIFDTNILNELPEDDPRVSFIFQTLKDIHKQLQNKRSSVLVQYGDPFAIWEQIISDYDIAGVYLNTDYEPYAIERDLRVKKLLEEKGIPVKQFKDQVIFEENEILKNDGEPYTVYTPFRNKWLDKFNSVKGKYSSALTKSDLFHNVKLRFPELSEIGFRMASVKVRKFDLSVLETYHQTRDFPVEDTTYLGPHLRFGTVSIRKLADQAFRSNQTFLNELIWREFFMQVLFHFPYVVTENFRSKYNGIGWRNEESEFRRWKTGNTGYPLVDAGMRQLNETGYMHNRVRMVVASFLCKHLLIDWRWGEAYFAEKLLDYELSSNNGNWQWAAGTGCDAAPYFRIFNPAEQLKKFDKELIYVKRWVPEYGTSSYPKPIVEHKFARERALETYRKGILK